VGYKQTQRSAAAGMGGKGVQDGPNAAQLRILESLFMSAPPTIAVGVDLGSSTTTVSTRHGEDRSESPHFDPAEAPVALAIPAAWDAERCREHAEAAMRAGFAWTVLVLEPEAAARYLAEAQGHDLRPDARLIVFNLGAGSCRVDIVHREGTRYLVDAALCADDIGGGEFDRLLLSYLSGLNRRDDPEFWAKAEDPAEAEPHTGLLDEIRRAREHLSVHQVAAIGLPVDWPELILTREELERCLAPAITRSMALIDGVLREAGIEAEGVAGILLVGGASRTPLVASMIRQRFGIEPTLPESPEGVLAEGAAFAALAHEQGAATAPTPDGPRRPSWLRSGIAVLAAVSCLVVIAIAAAVLVNRVASDDDAPGVVADEPGLPTATDPVDGSGGGETETGGQETDAASSPEPSEEDGTGDSTSTEAASTDPAPTTDDASEDATADDLETVPDVIGMSVSEAVQALADAGFSNVVSEGSKRTGDESGYENCETTGQTPGSGTRHAAEERITVTYVYVGNDRC